MGQLGTLDGFTFQQMLDKLTPPAGFVTDLRIWGNTLLLTIEDHRAHAHFEGDRSTDRLTELLAALSDLGLDAAKALVSLSCREELIEVGSQKSFNVGVVQLGWAISTPATQKRGTPERKRETIDPRPQHQRAYRSENMS